MSQDERPQRLRVTYRKADTLRYIAHLDLMRTWERSLRRARLPLAYTQGFTPHPRIALGAPLPVGTVGERELLDVWLSPPVAPEEFVRRLQAALPQGLTLLAAEEAAHELPSLQSQIRSATYEVAFERGAIDAAEVEVRLEALLALDTLDWEEQRGAKTRRYDLRAAIRDLALRDEGQRLVLAMDLELNEQSTGRPASVLAALEVEARPASVVRTALRLGEPALAGAEQGRA